MKIRPAAIADAPAIQACHRAAIQGKAREHYSQELMESWSPKEPAAERFDNMRSEIADAEYIYLVAEFEADIIGFAIALPVKQELRAVYVRPNPVGKVGSRLLTELVKQCVARNCQRLEMHASLNAEAFYTAHGFKSVERCQHSLRSGQPMECVRMSRELAEST